MKRLTRAMMVIPLLTVFATVELDATVRKCSMTDRTVKSYLYLLDELLLVEDPMTMAADGRWRDGAGFTPSEIPSAEVASIDVLCWESVDTKTGNKRLQPTVAIGTKEGPEATLAKLQAAMGELPARQTAYHAAYGGYAPTIEALIAFDSVASRGIRMEAQGEGWVASARFPRLNRSCYLAVGAVAMPKPGVEPGVVACLSD